MIAFHGTGDPLVPYEGGVSPTHLSSVVFPNVRAWAANWARRNRCGPNPVESRVSGDVTRAAYTHCANDAGVVLYTIRGGGHTWPGGKPMPKWIVGHTSSGVDATREMWAFFREHRLARR
jgi:polyhydroxybutyrate depolymerase